MINDLKFMYRFARYLYGIGLDIIIWGVIVLGFAIAVAYIGGF